MRDRVLIDRRTGATVVVPSSQEGRYEQMLLSGQYDPRDPDELINITAPGVDGTERLQQARAGDARRIALRGNQENFNFRVASGNPTLLRGAMAREGQRLDENYRRQLDEDATAAAFTNAFIQSGRDANPAANLIALGLDLNSMLDPNFDRALADINQANPGATLGGIAASTLPQILLPTGLLGVGTGARTVLAAEGLAARSGGIGRVLQRLLTSESLGATLSREAAESLIQSAQTQATLSQLNNTPLATEEILADAGIGALLGFGMIGVGRSVGGIARRLSHSPGASMVNEARMARLESAVARNADNLPTPHNPATLERVGQIASNLEDQAANIATVRSNLNDYANIRPTVRAAPQARQVSEGVLRTNAAALQDAVRPDDLMGQLQASVGPVGEALTATRRMALSRNPHEQIFDLRNRYSQILRNADPSDAGTALVERARENLDNLLSRRDLWGDAGGLIDAEKALTATELSIFQARRNTPTREAYVAQATSPQTYKTTLDNTVGVQTQVAPLLEQVNTFLRGNKAASQAIARGNAIGQEVGAIATSVAEGAARVAQADDKLSFKDIFSLLKTPLTGIAGAAVLGPKGAAIMSAGAMLLRPIQTVRRLTHFSNTVRNVAGRIMASNRALKRALESGERLALGTSRVRRGTLPTIEALRNKQTREETYEALSSQIISLSSNPQELMDTLTVSTEGLEGVSSDVAQEAAYRGTIALQYLHQALPQVPIDPLNPTLQAIKPSVTEMETFINKYAALEDPIGVYEDLVEGKATFEAGEAVRTVYPELYQIMAANAMTTMSEYLAEGGEISYQTRIQIGTFLGTETDATMASQFIYQMQSDFAQTPEQAQGIGLTGPRRGTGVRSMSNFSLTQSQSIEGLE